MLEYDDETYSNFNSIFSDGYAEGFMTGRLSPMFHILKGLTKEFTDNQIKGKDAAEGGDVSLLKFWIEANKDDMLDFYRRYESLNENQLTKRYIAESEYLPWRGF